VTKNRIIDVRRRQARWSERFEAMAESPTRTGEQEDHCDPNPSPLDRVWLEEWESHLLQSALAAVRGQVAEKQYLMYEMHVLQEVPLARVAANLQTSAMSVYLAKHRVGKRLRVELEKARERLDPR
jgi:DNA-directed RNA polymerase specialized sigma24 family protein